MRKKIASVLLALAVAAGIVAVATPAYALNPPQCLTTNEMCFWADANYQGDFLYSVNMQRGVCYNISAYMNDRTSSVWNRYSTTVQVFKDVNCGAGWANVMNVPSDGSYGQLGYWNDMISSYKLT